MAGVDRTGPQTDHDSDAGAADATRVSRRTLLTTAAVAGAAAAAGGRVSTGQAQVRQVQTRRADARATLVFGAEAVGADYAPAHTFQGWGHETARLHIYDTLYGYPGGDVTKPISPILASAMPRRDKANPRHYIVPLRKNVKFHDGTPFNADAVVFNFMRYLDNKHPFYDSGALFRGTYFMAGVYDVQKIDAYTVKFLTNRPLGDFASQLVAFAGIASPTAVQNAGAADYGLKPVGTGPMKFVQALRGDRVELVANDGYWGGRPTNLGA